MSTLAAVFTVPSAADYDSADRAEISANNWIDNMLTIATGSTIFSVTYFVLSNLIL